MSPARTITKVVNDVSLTSCMLPLLWAGA